MDEKEFKKGVMAVLVLALLAAAVLIVRPLFVSIILGTIFGYIFYPLFKRLRKTIHSEIVSALIIVAGTLAIILLPVILLIPILARQVVNAYDALQALDISLVLKAHFPILFNSISSSADVAAITSSFTTDIARVVLSGLQSFILNFPALIIQIVIVLFTFYFVLKDYEGIKFYFLSISPFAKDSEDRFVHKFMQVTNSIIYGQVIVGIAQGLIAGIGYFIFGVPNALLLTLLTMLVSSIPLIGAWLVWVPADIYLFSIGNMPQAIGLLAFCLFVVSWVDNIIRPLILSRMARMNPAIALIGMFGGLFVFGIVGLVLGPLILAYLLMIAEIYKEKRFKSILIEEKKTPVLGISAK